MTEYIYIYTPLLTELEKGGGGGGGAGREEEGGRGGGGGGAIAGAKGGDAGVALEVLSVSSTLFSFYM